MLHTQNLNWRNAAIGVLVLASLVTLFTFQHYGPSWDEEFCRLNAFNLLRWYQTWGADRAALHTYDLFLYGAFFDFLSYAISVFLPFDPYEAGHLVNAGAGIFGLWGAYRLAEVLSGPRAGFLAVLFLVLTPAYVGNSFINPKDLPFAVMYLWALYYIALYFKTLPQPKASTLWGMGFFIGLTLGIRIGGILLFGYVGLFAVLWLLFFRPQTFGKSDAKRYLGHALWVFVVAWSLMLLFWPYGQVKPFENPARAIIGNALFDFNPQMMFRGEMRFAKGAGWEYLPVSFLIRLPEFYFGLLLGLLGLCSLWKDKKRLFLFSLVGFAIVFPVVVAVVLRSTLYDGLRHFLFILPPVTVLLATSVDGFWQRAPRWARLTGGAALGVSLLLTFLDIVRLHPYEAFYFNRSVAGGVKNAAADYDFDYWGISTKEGMRWVLKNYHPDTNETIRIQTAAALYQLRNEIERAGEQKRFEVVRENPHLYFDVKKRGTAMTESDGKVIHTVERFGAPLLEIKEVRSPLLHLHEQD